MTNQEIKTVGQTIAAETQIGGNTAERVGGVIEGIGEALDNKDAAVGYYLATMSGSTVYINASNYRLGTGGNLRAKMPAAATTACTLTVGNANAVQLWYNGAAVSADNSWEAGEIVTIFYDGTRFMASNSQGGGGQFGSGEKIKDILLSQVLGAGTDAITSQKGVSDAIFNEIDISSIDTLKTLNDALAPSSSLKPTYYTVTATLSNVKLKVGSMAVISDNMRHVVTEIMATHYTLDDTGTLTNEHSDAEIFFIYRSLKLSGGTLPDPAGTWTKWRYVNSSVWSTAAEKIKYDNTTSGLAATDVQGAIDEITSLIPRDIHSTWGQGGIATVDGSNTEAPTRIRSAYIAVNSGDKIHVTPNGHYVSIYLYNQDKTSALGAYAYLLSDGGVEYEYVCPQKGWVRFVEAKTYSTPSQNILPSEQIAEINIDASSVVTPKELDAAINELLSTEVDISALSIQVGYPSTTGVWLTATLSGGAYRYHKLITRTAEMKKIKVDAPQDHATRYCFITDYTIPARNSDNTKEPTTPTPCNFCEDPAVVHNVGAGSSSGWVDIPDNCAYIVLVAHNGSLQYEPSNVYICKDDTDYDITGMRVLDNSAFVQGNFGADGKTPVNTTTQRMRTNGYYKVNEGDRIILDYQEQKLQVWKYDNNKDYLGNTGWYTERIFECENDGYLRFTAATARSNNDITTLYGKVYLPTEEEKSEDWRNEYADKVPNVARPPRKGNVVKSKMLALLTFSDIHLDRKDELQRILSFNDKYGSYFDDMISLGDLQDRGWESDIAVFRELADSGAKNVLQVIGNHDYYNSGANVWTYNTDANVYARFFAPFISNWGVVNTANTLYWYKDYTDTNTYTGTDAVPRKIRLIAINTNNNGSSVDKFDSTQQAWLTSVLADAKANDFSVIIASHYKPRMTYIDCNFSDKTLQLSNEENYANNAAATIIQDFIDGGGKFICWLCGHEHNDYVGVTSVAGTNQLVIGMSLAQCGVRVNYSVMDRVEGTKSQDLFNVIGFDTYNKHIRILRIGADMDIFMRSKKTLCINYETHDIIGQS